MNTLSLQRRGSLNVTLAIAILSGAISVRADIFLDVTALTPGAAGSGTFSGTLGVISVSGSISSMGGPPVFSFNAPGLALTNSTLDGTSLQFSDPGVFSPTAPFADRVGFTYMGLAGNLVTMTFSSPVTDPVFHVANLDWGAFSFLPTPGFMSLTLLGGNDGMEPDGIDPDFGGPAYGNALLWDLDPATSDATGPFLPPPSAGPRSAYASVRINGTFSTLAFMTDAMGPFSDGGSFTVSVPEPGTVMLIGIGSALAGSRFLRRRKRQ